MEHVVFYPGSDGAPAFGRFASMDEAVAFVEHLRNDSGVNEASLFALTPVPMVVKTYFRVEVPPVEVPAELSLVEPVAEPAPAALVHSAPVDSAPVDEAPVDEGPAEAPVDEGPAQAPVEAAPVDEAAVEDAALAEVPEQAGSAEETPVVLGTPDIIAPAHNGRRSLGFFNH